MTMNVFHVPPRKAPTSIADHDPGDESDWNPARWTCSHTGSVMIVLPDLLGLHWEFVRDVDDGHDDTNGAWHLLYADGSPATAEDRELVYGKFTPADHALSTRVVTSKDSIAEYKITNA